MGRIEELKEKCSALSDDMLTILEPTIEDIAFEEDQLKSLRENPKTKTNINMNKAYRQIKQLYQSDIKILITQLKQNGDSDDGLLDRLKEFE